MILDDEPLTRLGCYEIHNSVRPLTDLVKVEKKLKKKVYKKRKRQEENYTPFRDLLKKVDSETVKLLKQLSQETKRIMFPKGSKFCELVSYCSPFSQEKRFGDGNCSTKKAQGCDIYRKYQIIQVNYPNDNEALEILRTNEKNHTKKRDYKLQEVGIS